MANLEQILARLLEPDNDVIQKATLDLKEAFKDPATLQNLCQILWASDQPQIKQYAAVLVRRKIYKAKQWAALDQGLKDNIRGNILQLLVQEGNASARAAIAQVIGCVARHDVPSNQWPALFEFLVNFVKNEDPAKREAGMLVLSSVTSIAGEQLKPHMASLLELLTLALADTVNAQVAYLSIKCMTDLVFYIGDDEMKIIQNVVPRVLEVIQGLTAVDEEKACTALELFDELLESEVAIIVPHLKTLVEYCLQIASTKDLSDQLRVKAMSFIASLVRLKKKTVLKHQLVDPILQVLFPIICDDEEEEEDEDDDIESARPSSYAVQVIDTMALHLPAEKFIKKVTGYVDGCLQHAAAGHRRAAYLVLAVVVEGCGDYVMNKLLKEMLNTVCQGLNDPSPIVRNASLFAVGQFSEHLQPDISLYASELLPMLFDYLNKSMQNADKNPKAIVKSFYAVEMFCENLSDAILPFLPTLMEYLLTVLKTSDANKPKELAISAIGAAANAAEEHMKPYFPAILELFKAYLTTASECEEMKKLQVATIDTLSVLARTVGVETFGPLARECTELGLRLLQTTEDPDLRRCVFSLFAAISVVIKTDLAEWLGQITDHLLKAMKSTEGIKAHFKEEAETVTVFDEDDFNDDENLEDDDDEDNYKLEGISVENAYLDEKEDACCALGEVAISTGAAFAPYLQVAFAAALELAEYPAGGVKKSAIQTLSQLCLCLHDAQKAQPQPSEEWTNALKTMILSSVPKFLEAIKTELDRTVVMQAVDCIQELLDKIGQPVLELTGATEAILTAMKEIFTHKVACQDDEDEDGEEAEFDTMLIESAGDVLPVMARILGMQAFLPFFSHFVKDLLKRMKETSSTPEKSFAVGVLAECIEAAPGLGEAFVPTLYPVFCRTIKDEDDEVRSNSAFAMGVLAVNGGNAMVANYPDILKIFFNLNKSEGNARVLDNVCGAVCRMIFHSPQSVPLPQVLPVVMSLLPLKQDFEEYVTVFTCLMKLYTEALDQLMPHIPKMLEVVAELLVPSPRTHGQEPKIKDETKSMLIQWVGDIRGRFPAEFERVAGQLAAEPAQALAQALAS